MAAPTVLTIAARPHNGTPSTRVKDPVTGQPVGGQIAYIRWCIRNKRFIAAWGRRAAKSTARRFLWPEECALTPGRYNAGFVAPDHTKAWEAFLGAKEDLAPFILESHGDPESQNRYHVLKAMSLTERPDYLAPDDPRWERVKAHPNTGGRIYFWSGQHPHYEKIRGFTFPFHRISLDEPAQLHQKILRVVSPMTADAGGAIDVSGTPDHDGIGNFWFEQWYLRGLDDTWPTWASLNFPTWCNPHLSEQGIQEIVDDCLTDDDYQQEVLARFITGKGAVFGNFENVFVLPILHDRNSPPEWVQDIQASAPCPDMRFWIHENEPRPGHSLVLSIDWAKHRDATIMSVYDLSPVEYKRPGSGLVVRLPRQVAVFMFQGDNYTEQLGWAQGIKDHYGAHEVHGDENNGNGVAMGDFLRQRYETGIIPHKFSVANKGAYVRRGQFLFYNADVLLMKVQRQIDEFKSFRKIVPKTQSGEVHVRYSHPPEGHDDFVDVFLQVSEALTLGGREKEEPVQPKSALFAVNERGLEMDVAAFTADVFDDDDDGAARFVRTR